MQLTQRQESLIKSLYKRHGRKKHGLCVCEGERCCRELINSQGDLIEMAICSEEYDSSSIPLDFIKVSVKKFQNISNTVNAQGILLVARIPDLKNCLHKPTDPFIVVLDRISDPGNLGTMLRTIRAVGLKEFWLTAGSADPYNDKVIRSALGAQFFLNPREFESLDSIGRELRKYGYNRLYRTDPHSGQNCFKEKNLFDKSAIIFGGEACGAGEIMDSVPLRIPMPGNTESLNVAQALTVILFEFVKNT